MAKSKSVTDQVNEILDKGKRKREFEDKMAPVALSFIEKLGETAHALGFKLEVDLNIKLCEREENE